MNFSEKVDKLIPAMIAVQSVGLKSQKDAINDFYGKSPYSTITSVWEAIRQPLADNGIAVFQSVSSDEHHQPIIHTRLFHTSGQYVDDEMTMPFPPPTEKELKRGMTTKNDPQTVGILITYGRRYHLAAMVGVCPEDDDGEGAYDRTQTGRNQTKSDKTHKAWQKKEKEPYTPTTPKAALYSIMLKEYGDPIAPKVLKMFSSFVEEQSVVNNCGKNDIYQLGVDGPDDFLEKFEAYATRLDAKEDGDGSITKEEEAKIPEYIPPEEKTPEPDAMVAERSPETLELEGKIYAGLPPGASVSGLRLFLADCQRSNDDKPYTETLNLILRNMHTFAGGMIDFLKANDIDPGYNFDDIKKPEPEAPPEVENQTGNLDNGDKVVKNGKGYTELQKKYMPLAYNAFEKFLIDNESAFINIAERTKAREKWENMSKRAKNPRPFPLDKDTDTSAKTKGITIAPDSVPPKIRMKGFQNLYPKLAAKILKDLGMAKTVQSNEAAMKFVDEAVKRTEAYEAKHKKPYEE